jgi:hypothetical protein
MKKQTKVIISLMIFLAVIAAIIVYYTVSYYTSPWKSEYISFLNSTPFSEEDEFSLINLNNDDTCELLFNDEKNNKLYLLYTNSNNVLNKVYIGNTHEYFRYKDNLFYSQEFNPLKNAIENVYSLSDKKITKVLEGIIDLKHIRNNRFIYSIDNHQLEYKTYTDKLNSVFDRKSSKTPMYTDKSRVIFEILIQ